MTTKEYLGQIIDLKYKIQRERKELKELEEMAVCIGSFDYSKDPVKTTKTGDNIEKKVIKIEAMKDKITSDIIKYCDKRHEIIKQIDAMDDGVYKNILCLRYLDGMRLEEIAIQLNYSYNRIRHLHGVALVEFDKLNKVSTQ